LAGAKENKEVLESHHLLAAHLCEQGSQVEERTYPKVGHMGIMVALAPGFRRLAPLRDDIVRFVNGRGFNRYFRRLRPRSRRIRSPPPCHQMVEPESLLGGA